MAKAALELYSIRELMQQDVLKALENTAKAGYDGVEFAGFFGVQAQQIKEKLDELDMEVCGSHTRFDQLINNIEEVFEYNKTIQNKTIILPGIPEDLRKNANDWKSLGKRFTEIGKKCADNGFVFGYHNHYDEFKKFKGLSGYQIMVDNINPKYVKLQLDIGWIFYAGEDIWKFIVDYGELIINVHVKQFKQMGSYKAVEIYKGAIYYPPVIAKFMEIGIEWFIIEQEGFDMPMIESIKLNCRALKKMFKDKTNNISSRENQ